MSPRGRRDEIVLRLLFLVLLIAAACQPVPTVTPALSPPPVSSATSSNQTAVPLNIPQGALKGITVDAWYPWFGVEASLFESEVQDFNQSNQWGIKVSATGQGSYAQLYDSTTAALDAPQRPQLAIALPAQALAWDARGYVVDLTSYVRDPQYGLTSAEQDDFPIVFWSQDEVAGRRLGVPAERTARFIVYNRTWAHNLGFDTAPQNADDFGQQACRAHQAMLTDANKTNDGQGGWLVDASGMSFLSWMMAFGGGVLDGNGYRFLTPRNLAGLTFVKQLYNEGCAWTAQPDSDLPAAFAARKALFATASLEELPDYSRAMGAAENGDDWSLIGFPGPVQTGLVTYGSSYVVLKSTPPQQLAAWLFVRWLLSPENQKDWVEATGLFPLRNSALPELDGYRKSHPQWSAAVDLLPKATIEPQLASWRQVTVMIGDGFDAMFRSNTPTGRVAEILAIMGTAATDLSK
jgi:multiple sugar transport system substrate-binding protein